MDFHSLSRKDLQALCKKNNIRANMTNAAMADALKALDSVEGLEDIQLTIAPKTKEVLPESPEKTAARSVGPPRSCRRTSNRRKAIQDSADLVDNESKDVEESMRRPRTCRGMAAKSSAARRICKEEEEKEEEEEANMPESLAENNRSEPLKTPVTRIGRKKGMAIALVKKLEKEEQHDVPEFLAENNRSQALKTPRTRNGRKMTTANSSARSKVETEKKEGKENDNPTTVGSRPYSTRRSSRLLAKSLQEEASSIHKSRRRKETIKIAALLAESEDPEKEIKEGFERSDLEEEEEQGVFINQFTRKDGQVQTAVNQNLALNDAVANIPEEDASRDNQTAVLESPTSLECCILESRKSKAEDSVDSSLVENHALEFPSPCRKSLGEDSSSSSLRKNEMPACSDGAAAADTPEEDASGGKQTAVLDCSASSEFCIQEKSVDEDSIDSSLVEKQMLEFSEYANVPEEDASASNGTAVLVSPSSPESFIQESGESVDEDSIDSSFMENQLLKCSKDAIADIPKEAASGGNRTAVLESPPPESCIQENRSFPEEDSIDSSFVENHMLKHEESEPDPDAGGDTDLDLDLKMIASGTSGEVSDEIMVGSTSTENLMVEIENCDLYADDDDLLHPKDAVDQVGKEVLVEVPVDVVEIHSEVSYEIVVESITAENMEECKNCNLDEADQVPSDVVSKDPVDTDENEADQIPTDVSNEMLGDLDQVPGEDEIQIEDTAEVSKPQCAKCDADAVDDPDLHLIEVADQVPADTVAEISVNEDAKISCDGCLTEEMKSLVLLFAENLTLKSEKCIPLSISDPDQENDTDGKKSDETVTENQLLESEICNPGPHQDKESKASDVEISVEDESGERITYHSSEKSILDRENCHTDANTGLILGLEIVSDLLPNEVSLKTASSSSSSSTNMIENTAGIEDFADDSVTSLLLGQKNVTDALSDGSSLEKPAWSIDSATDHCETDADAGLDLVLDNVAAGIASAGLDYCDRDSITGLDLGQKNVIDALSDDSTLEKPAQDINSGTDHCKADADADLYPVLENVTDLFLGEVSPMTTESGTSSPVVATNTAEREKNANDQDHSILENSTEGCEKASPDATIVQYLQTNPEISATEISSESRTWNGILRTPASMRSKRVEAPGSAKSWGYKSSKALRLSLSAKKVTPMRSKILMEETDKENKNVGLGSGKRERKDFRSTTKVRMVVVEGEDSKQKSLKKKSLRQLKGMLKEKMRLKNEKRSALHVLSDNCSLGKGVNGET